MVVFIKILTHFLLTWKFNSLIHDMGNREITYRQVAVCKHDVPMSEHCNADPRGHALSDTSGHLVRAGP